MLTRWRTGAWTVLAAIAVLWPSRFIGPLDGAPFDQPSDALLLGLVLPSLWWLSRDRFRSPQARAVVVALLLWKAATGLAAQQQGVCMVATAPAPLSGTAMTMRIDEPRGYLRSWDVRADLWSDEPRCTAIITRPLRTASQFPMWFVNITDQMIGRRDVTLRFSGSFNGDNGVMRYVESIHATNEALSFVPVVEGRSIFDLSTFTVGEPRAVDRLFARWAWIVSPLLCVALIGILAADVMARTGSAPIGLWILASSTAAIVLATAAPAVWMRAAGAITLGVALIPMRSRWRNARGAFLLVGVPWLAFFAARSFPQIGAYSVYSTDDWLAFQVAGYRIFMNGFFIEGGSPTFDYQPLYRWTSGVLHLIFGDSSVGEVYWDAACLLSGALLSFQIVRLRAGFRAGVIAGALALATFTAGTPWHFFGRGLSEIAAAGWAFLAMWFLLRSRLGARRWVVAGTAMAILMFLARLNHLLWAAFLPAMLLPLRVPMEWPALVAAVRRLRVSALAIYASGFAAALLLFMTRTWYYTGSFSMFYGTSLRHNDTGLRPWTMLDGAVWSKVGHSLWAFVWMNEPTGPDARSIVMAIGALVTVAALLQVPLARRVPAALVLAAVGSVVGGLFAHAHVYPGRFSIHAVPLASAMTVIALAGVRTR